MMREKYNGWSLPDSIKERLGQESYGRQRVIEGDGQLLIILHEPPLMGENSRKHRVFLRADSGQWFCDGRADGDTALTDLLKAYRDRFATLDEAEENAVSADDTLDVLDQLTPINRSSTMLARALQAARQAAPDDRFLIAARDLADEISRDFDLLVIDASHDLNYHTARNAEKHAEEALRQSVSQSKLNVLAAMTMPLVVLSGLFGMNLVSGLEHTGPWLFVLVLFAGIAIGLAIKSWVTRL